MFSVVIPLWNKQSSVAQAVRSVLDQNFRDFELIVVDDGSTDGSVDALAAVTDPRLRILRQTNAGPGAARNRGIEAASHDWIAFLDADDLWFPDHLAELDRVRSAFPEAGLIGTAMLRRKAGDLLGQVHRPAGRVRLIRYFAEVGRIGAPLRSSSAAIPSCTHDLLGGFSNARIGEDSEYWARIALALPVAASDRVTAIYSTGTGGLIESGRGRWHGIASRRAIAPALALVEKHYPEVASEELRSDLDAFILRYLGWTLEALVAEADVKTLRDLRRLYPGDPPARHHLLLALARLPRPLARTALRLACFAVASVRGLGGRVRRQ